MLGAAPEYTNLVDGLEPDFRKHQILIDVEPVSIFNDIWFFFFYINAIIAE